MVRASEGGGDNFRTLSFASSPHDKRPVMIAMRMRKTPFKTALKSAALGTKFNVSRPRGSFTLHRDFTRPAVFLASGIGISAIRSILRKAAQERLPHGLYLFYSNREADDAAFIEEFIFVASQGHHRHAPPFSISHSRLIDRYLDQASTECRFPTELMQTSQGFHQRVLCNVLCIFLIRKQREHHRVDRPLMGADKIHEQLFVPRQDLVDQSSFRGSSRTPIAIEDQAIFQVISRSRLSQRETGGSSGSGTVRS